MKIVNKRSFYTGFFIVILQLFVFLKYLLTGCISMPQVPEMCTPNADGPLVGLAVFAIVGIYLILSGLDIFKKIKHKD
jgi:hypothetical protein